jgi:hypothetical protein
MREIATRAADVRVLRPLAQTGSLSTGRFEHFQTTTRPIDSGWTCLSEARMLRMRTGYERRGRYARPKQFDLVEIPIFDNG